MVVTHYLPAWKSVSPRYRSSQLNRFFVCDMETLIESAQTDVHLGLPDRAAAQIRDAMTIIEEIGGGLLERQARAVLDALR